MFFSLTDELVLDIVEALENQEKQFLVDAKNCILVEKTQSVGDDGENYYEIPKWTSENGFLLREKFVKELHSPLVQEELQEILHSGRGVFRNFKLVLKKYPEIEKKWHIFKNRSFALFINDWYNGLREIWGLEKLDQIPEYDENLIHDDFSFCKIEGEFDKDELFAQMNEIFRNDCQNCSEEVKSALYDMWKQHFLSVDSAKQTGFICRSLSEDFAGCIIANPVSEKQENVVSLSTFFVPETFRGLGIGSELLSLYLEELKKNGKKWIVIPELITPEIIEPLLFRMGFEKVGSGYAAKLQ